MDNDLLKAQIEGLNKVFYTRMYNDPWLAQVFKGIQQEHIEKQQTYFMLGALGGPKEYIGKSPRFAHPHIYVDEAMWQVRENHLKAAFLEVKFPTELQFKWLKIDEAFKAQILKSSISECTKRWAMDEIIAPPKPSSYKPI